MITVHRYHDSRAAREGAAGYLNTVLERLSGGDTLLLSSGGTALELVNFISEANLSRRLTLSVLDERFSSDPQVNNCARLQSTAFADKARRRSTQFILTTVLNRETPDGLANRFEDSLRSWCANHPDGTIIATFGIGPDGHTAGIMPYPEDPNGFHLRFEDTDRWVVAYDATGKNLYPLRITTTVPFLRMVHTGIVFVSGNEKSEALFRVLDPRGSIAETPARLLRDIPSVSIHTDIPAE